MYNNNQHGNQNPGYQPLNNHNQNGYEMQNQGGYHGGNNVQAQVNANN